MESLIYRDSPEESLAKATEAATALMYMSQNIEAAISACESWGENIRSRESDGENVDESKKKGAGIAKKIGAYIVAAWEKIINFLTSAVDFLTTFISSSSVAVKANVLKAQLKNAKDIPNDAFDIKLDKGRQWKLLFLTFTKGPVASDIISNYANKACDLMEELKVDVGTGTVSGAAALTLEALKEFNTFVSEDTTIEYEKTNTISRKIFGISIPFTHKEVIEKKTESMHDAYTPRRVMKFFNANCNKAGVEEVVNRFSSGRLIVDNMKLVIQKNRLKNVLIKAKRDAKISNVNSDVIKAYNEAIKTVNGVIKYYVSSSSFILNAMHAVISYSKKNNSTKDKENK